MNEGQNDNLSTKSLPTHKPARTISSACTSAVCVYERERDKRTETEKSCRKRQAKRKERKMSMYLHGSLVVKITPVAGS